MDRADRPEEHSQRGAGPTPASRRASARSRNRDLHGNVPENAPVALLLVDVINAMEFEHGEEFARRAERAARNIARLKQRASEAGIPTIYANDNFGRWTSDFRQVVEHVLDGTNGATVARMLEPGEDDYFVLKPKHSAFFATTLDTLLLYLGARTLVLAGFAADMCVLFTANDAYMRDYDLVVPADCIASSSEEASDRALAHIRAVLKADTSDSDRLDLKALVTRTRAHA